MAQRRGRPYWSWFPSAPFREERKSRVVATVEQLAALVRGRLVGDGSVSIHSARPVGEAGPGDITFIENERYAKMLRTSPASAAIVGPHFKRDRGRTRPCRSSRSTTRSSAFLAVRTPPRRRREAALDGHPSAGLGRADRQDRRRRRDLSVRLRRRRGRRSATGATLHPGVVVGDRCRVGARRDHPPQRRALSGRRSWATASRSTPGPCWAATASATAWSTAGTSRSPRPGGVEVGDDVEIGANCTIDRATFEATRIGEGTKIDNLVMIGHNNQIGRHNLLCGQVGHRRQLQDGRLRGHGRPGRASRTTPRSATASIVGAQAGVHRNIPGGQHVLGSPAIPVREQRRLFQMIARLPEMHRQLRELSAQVARLTAALRPRRRGRRRRRARIRSAERSSRSERADRPASIAARGRGRAGCRPRPRPARRTCEVATPVRLTSLDGRPDSGAAATAGADRPAGRQRPVPDPLRRGGAPARAGRSPASASATRRPRSCATSATSFDDGRRLQARPDDPHLPAPRASSRSSWRARSPRA